ncbi:DUF3515 domain-containing protein [Streptomyces sp. ME19-01-6]|uniref:DUF3515 domain-containing protein n=1 Tax=Streptomyces sp. ME19-01-6 TaxID=3028686 RepID=UPI0029B71939|nr:DUF3515 domain-containing protein [Streptomyces sp. ME19-01-6]MDX3224693.1 DUF3515 domain-containing protein [Streptomyces sp. ME19-01-6]
MLQKAGGKSAEGSEGMMGRLSRKGRIAVGVAAAGLVVAGVVVVRVVSSPAFGVEAAPRGDAPECGRIAKEFPSRLDGRERADGGAAGVAVWGDRAVVLRCGMSPPLPTADPCVEVNGVDWVVEEAKSRDGEKVVITYGRDPAVEVSISDRVAGIDGVLVELSKVVKPIRQQRECLSVSDVPGGSAQPSHAH